MKAMIFAAGLGTRLRPLTDSIPKALVPLAGQTLLEYQIRKLKEAGIEDIIINIHHFPEQIRNYLTEHHNFGMNIALSDETEQLLDTGGGLKKASWFFRDNETVLVLNVDILSNIDLQHLIASHQASDMATVVVSKRDTQRYLLFDNAQHLQGWTNIRTGEVRGKAGIAVDNLQHLAFSGMQIINPAILRFAEGLGERFSLIDLYMRACHETNISAYIPQDYRMMDVGKIEHIQEAEDFAESLRV